jgi:translation initiation factor IF-2
MPNQTKTNQFRPPIVAVMGHIDHGKTSLLDRIRTTHVTNREFGGITQHISANKALVKTPDGQTRPVTFIDTPGHSAFCQMRTRGAQITDMVVLVISAVDGVMSQTKECIKEIIKTNIPVIIAMNKIDLEGSQPEKIKGQLVETGLTPEDYGGQVPLIPVSAKTGQGIDNLLESIFLHADIMELKDESSTPLTAFVYESRLDKSCGPVASVIVKTGRLSVGDTVFAGNIATKIKSLTDSTGQKVTSASPSDPVEILGFESVPAVGSIISSEKIETAPTSSPMTKPTQPQDTPTSTPKLKIVLKADVGGTLEALKASLSDDVVILSQGVGTVTDNDVFLATPSHAQIFAFNVSVPRFIKNLADSEKVPIFESKIIYEIIENIQAQVLKLLDPTIEETTLGEAKISAEFKINKVRIAGLGVTKGQITKGDRVHLLRDSKIIKDTRVDGIRQGKNVVDQVKMGVECGMTFKPYVDFELNDVIIAYKDEKL